jgi:hypothetical protein
LLDVLVGASVVCMIFRRQTGVTVSDVLELDNEDRVIRLLACYRRQT